MNLERAAMQGRLAEARDREQRLRLRIEGFADGLRTGLNTALIAAADLDLPRLAEQWDCLEAAWVELQKAKVAIARLERELR